MAFEHTNSKGTTYYLHSRQAGKNGTGKLYYFSKDKNGADDQLPAGYEIKENTKTGLPVLKKK